MTLVEQELLDALARQRRIKREEVEAQIAAVEQRLANIDRDIADKKRLLTELAEIQAAVTELPMQVQGKRVAVGGGGLHNATIACLRTELLSSLTGGQQVQAMRLDTLTSRRESEAKQLVQLREGIKEFEEVAA
jgi:hypothetical protein